MPPKKNRPKKQTQKVTLNGLSEKMDNMRLNSAKSRQDSGLQSTSPDLFENDGNRSSGRSKYKYPPNGNNSGSDPTSKINSSGSWNGYKSQNGNGNGYKPQNGNGTGYRPQNGNGTGYRPQNGNGTGYRPQNGHGNKPHCQRPNQKERRNNNFKPAPKEPEPVADIREDSYYFDNQLNKTLPSREVYGTGSEDFKSDARYKNQISKWLPLDTNFYALQKYKNKVFQRYEPIVTEQLAKKNFKTRQTKVTEEVPNKILKSKILAKIFKDVLAVEFKNLWFVSDFGDKFYVDTTLIAPATGETSNTDKRKMAVAKKELKKFEDTYVKGNESTRSSIELEEDGKVHKCFYRFKPNNCDKIKFKSHVTENYTENSEFNEIIHYASIQDHQIAAFSAKSVEEPTILVFNMTVYNLIDDKMKVFFDAPAITKQPWNGRDEGSEIYFKSFGMHAQLGYRLRTSEIQEDCLTKKNVPRLAMNIDMAAKVFINKQPVRDFILRNVSGRFLKRLEDELGWTDPEFMNRKLTRYDFWNEILAKDLSYDDNYNEYENIVIKAREQALKCLKGLKIKIGDKIVRLGAKPDDILMPNHNGVGGQGYPSSSKRLGKNKKIKGRVDPRDAVSTQFSNGFNFNKNLNCLEDTKGDRYPIELCTIIAQPFKGLISRAATATLLNKISYTAPAKQDQIRNFFSFYESDGILANKTTERLKLSISKDMINLEGFVLNSPKIQMRDSQNKLVNITRTPKEIQEGEWSADNQFLKTPKDVQKIKIACLVLQDPDNPHSGFQQNVEKFLMQVFKILKEKGSYSGWVNDDHSQTNKSFKVMYTTGQDQINLKDYYYKMKNDGYKCVIAVLPSDDNDNYNIHQKIVDIADSSEGITTNCVLYDTIINGFKLKKMKAVIDNFTQKLNYRLGGINHQAEMPKIDDISIFPENSMLIGADVTHAETKDTKASTTSIAGVVASYDDKFVEYASNHKSHKHRQEMISKFRDICKDFLKTYQKKNGHFPDHIFYFRDGVSESQFQQVLHTEDKELTEAVEDLTKSKVKINCIIVQKRHNTKFFCNDPKDQVGKTKNPPAGTVADTTIVNPRDRMEFYLQSHYACKGTARSTKYVVIKNESELRMSEYELGTNALCSNYQLTNKSVSLPAPVYYAHKQAERARNYEKISTAYPADLSTRIIC